MLIKHGGPRDWRTTVDASTRHRRGIGVAGFLVLPGLIGLASVVVAQPLPVTAAPTELFISEYIEGTSNNKAIEIFNGTGALGEPGDGCVRPAVLLQRQRHRPA